MTLKLGPYKGHPYDTQHVRANQIKDILIELGVKFEYDPSLVSVSGFTRIMVLDGRRVGFMTHVPGDPKHVNGVKDTDELDILFCSNATRFHLNVIPFAPPAWKSWDEYRWAAQEVVFDPRVDYKVLAHLHGPVDSVMRTEVRRILGSYQMFDSLVGQKDFWATGSFCKCFVGAPGVSLEYLDRSTVQMLALGVAVVHPEWRMPWVGGTPPYIKCDDYYKDLLELVVTDYKQHEAYRIGMEAKEWYRRNQTPGPLWEYVQRHVGEAKGPRTVMDRVTVDRTLKDMRNQRCIERYRMARLYCNGTVLDYGCGVGFGAYVLGQAKQIAQVFAYDSEAVVCSEFLSDKVQAMDHIVHCDCLVALEVIEHMDRLEDFKQVVVDAGTPKRLVISFPRTKTTPYNEWHKIDVKDVHIMTMLPAYKVVYRLEGESTFMVLDKK